MILFQLHPGDTQCINVQLLKDANVGKLQPATVKAFEYCRPGKKYNLIFFADCFILQNLI